MRKLVSVTLAVVLLASSGVACGPKETVATPTPEHVTIAFWHGQAGVLGEVLEARVAEFNKTHPNITVQPEFVGNWTELNQKVMAAIAGGAPPPLAQVGAPAFTAEYLRSKAIVPMEEFVHGENGLSKEELDDIFPALLELNTFEVEGKGVLASWPFSNAVTVLFYNADMFQEMGLDVPSNWDEFREACKKWTIPGERWGIGWAPSLRLLAPMIYQNGGQLLSDDMKEVRFNSPAAVRALEYLLELVNVDKSMILTKGYDHQALFVNEKIGMAISTVVSMRYILRAMEDAPKKFRLGMAPLPAGPKRATATYGANAVIFAQTSPAEQAAAWEFLKWWAQPENTAVWTLETAYMPIRRSAIELSIMQESFKEDPHVKLTLESMEYAVPFPNITAWAQISPVLAEAMEAVFLGEATPQEALDKAAQKANEILKAQ